ncbi:MFS transporter [Natrinema caseinilyticum]|uniref:MFS transporter n=1 Tax=Natrinema caseinilyticum TaxID=2961570 RepID=UPI0020C4E842|nr:MFS transporter [Natrinema caseinilyticum]
MDSLTSLFGADADIIRERNFQLLLLSNVPPVVGTALLSPVLNSLIEPFGTSAANVGLIISVFTAPGIFIIPVIGGLADRFGRKPILVASLLLFGVTGPAVAFTTDFRVVLVLRLLQGIGFAGVVPTIITSIGDLYEGSREATAQGLRFSVSGLSQAVFPLAAGLLVTLAWQYPFLLYAVALPCAVLVYFYFDEPTATVADGGEAPSYSRELFGLVRQPRVLSFVVARTLPVVVWVGFLTYNSIIVVDLMDGTPAQAGLLSAIGSFAFAGAASQAGQITALFDSRYYPLLAANGCLGVGLATVLVAPTIVVACLGIGVTGIGFGATLSLYRTIITGLAPPSLRAGLVSLSEAGGRVTATGTPIAMGAVIATATPALGFEGAVQVTGLGAALIGGGGGVLCLVVARLSSPVSAERDRTAQG